MSLKDHFPSTTPSKTYLSPSPTLQLLLPPFPPPLTFASAPWNPLVSPFKTSASCVLCPALPDLFFPHSSPFTPCSHSRFKSLYHSWDSGGRRGCQERQPEVQKAIRNRLEVCSIQMDFGDTK